MKNSKVFNSKSIINFGKYKGKTLEYIADKDNSYILWMNKESILNFDKEFLKACEMDDYMEDGKKREIFEDD